ncbi:MAG: response regulator transcription factor [Oscillospiraceae bacterium]|nr:response regulator transcription factor [Oscillospiraceae bacterium]
MRVAIIEDELISTEILQKYFLRFGQENNCSFLIDTFDNSVDFLASYRPDYDLVILDIEMPKMDGMTCAQALRDVDPYVPIVFVTNMSNYAVKGYAVSALDYILKPISYFEFETMLNRLFRIRAASTDQVIMVKSGGITRPLRTSHIIYVEVYRHKLTFHTINETVEAWGSLTDIAAQLPADCFSNCTNSYLVNLKYVKTLGKDDVVVGNDRLPVSHLRRKAFVQELTRYLGRRR